MKPREIVYGKGFSKSLKSLEKKHQDLPATVQRYLDKCSQSGKLSTSSQIPKLGDGFPPVFKDRLPLRGKGKRGGVRIIYSYEDHRIRALFLYTKNQRSDVPIKEIQKALTTD